MAHPVLKYHLPNRQPWAVEQMQGRHNDALYRFGEYSMFVLLWKLRDFSAGYVARCTNCQVAAEAGINQDILDVYKQSPEHNCPVCLNTTFEGGYKAKIIRPSLWDFSEDVEQDNRRGVINTAQAAVQSTPDFRMDVGDYIIRADGTRWNVQSLATNHLRTGFEYPMKSETILGFNYGRCVKEDPSSVAFEVAPKDPSIVRSILDLGPNTRFPVDFAAYEDVRADLEADMNNTLAALRLFAGDFTYPSETTFPGDGTP